MGRFGNVLLVNGEPDLSFRAAHGEVVRFYLTNTANTRVFNLSVRGAGAGPRRVVLALSVLDNLVDPQVTVVRVE